MKREIVCITCPNSCVMEVTMKEAGQVSEVSGNRCVRGADFAKSEVAHPVRTLCTTVRTIYKECSVLPVRVNGTVPKERIREAMNAINQVTVDRPVGIGDVILSNLLGLGVDVIATSSVLREL
ncbi:MAG: DUF1667 domain-containing protein [Anaerovoracaceae bacterium]